MPNKKNKGIYCVPKDTNDFREIAKIMTSLGYPMTHGTAYFFFNRAISKLITHSFTNLVNSDQSVKDDFSEQDLQDIIHNFQKNTELQEALGHVLILAYKKYLNQLNQVDKENTQ